MPTQKDTALPPKLKPCLADFPLIQLSMINKGKIALAPIVTMHIASDHREALIDVLPDSGADICAAGPQFVAVLGEHIDNLAVHFPW